MDTGSIDDHLLALREIGVDSRVLWSVAPELYLRTGMPDDPGQQRSLTSDARRLWGALRGRTRIRATLRGDVLFLSVTANQERVLATIAGGRLGSTLRWPSGVLLQSWGRAQTSAMKVNASGVLRDAYPGEAAYLTNVIRDSAIVLPAAEAVLQRLGPSTVVVATQHNPTIRAFALAACRLNIRTIYFPHAPTALNRAYSDGPFSLLALRGPEEARMYRSWGAIEQRVMEVGVPLMGLGQEPAQALGGHHPILAISNWPLALLQSVISFVRGAIDGPVCVAPHPAMDPALLRLIPEHWTVNERESTASLMRTRPAPVLQMSSGIAWEAMLSGLPVIQLVIQNTPTNYPLIAEPYAHFVRSPEELRRAISKLDWYDPTPTVDWARKWGWPVGEQAVLNARRLLERGPTDAAGEFALDSWTPVLTGAAGGGIDAPSHRC